MINVQSLTEFFKWCSIINAVLLIFSIIVFIVMPDFVYRIHGHWFPMDRESFNVIIYGSLGFYKILFLVFNLIPYVALRIIGGKQD